MDEVVDKTTLATQSDEDFDFGLLCQIQRASHAVASIYELKPRFQSLLRPSTTWLAARGVTANQVTLAAALLSMMAGAAVAMSPNSPATLLLVPGTLFVRMALNAIDGMLAREFDMKSKLGAVLNEIGDVVSDAAIYLPLALVDGMPKALLISVVVLGIVGEMAGVVAIQVGAERRYDGPLGKSDRAFAFGLISFLLACGLHPGPWLAVMLAIMTLLAALTIFNRSRRALQLATKIDPTDTG
jgi:CDP-diacylglycerol---glycerol-3-phosphate 3-phosphatidyltransferase